MRLVFSLFSLLILGITGQSTPQQASVIISISQGTVVGSLSENGNYAEFHGIPYADATSGSNRFKAPNPPPSFQDPFVANRKDVKCVRALGTGYEGTEDCLVANVFTPTIDSSRQLSVMVWVKGKEFDKVYDSELSLANFVQKDVVVVSLNYRESVLGFLCLGTDTAPGNAGLKDIIAGLRWVKENIAQFGGNPNDITLIGHGSGAAAVDLVTMSPMSNGLVNKVIAQSGNALSPWAVSRDNLNYAIEVAEALGHVVSNVEELSEVFRRTSVAALMAVINELDLTDNSLAFAPCIERENLSADPFLVKTPYEILRTGEFLHVPIIIGYVDNEGTIRSKEAVEDDWLTKMDNSFTDFLQPDLAFANNQDESQVAQKIRTQYFQNDPIDMDNIDNYINYHGDTMILVSALREIRLRVLASSTPVFVYQFSYKGTLGEPFVGPISVDSAAHSEELAYMFFDEEDDETPERDMVIGDILVERWTNFAKTSLPQSETSQVMWRPFTFINSFYLRFLESNEITNEATLEVSLQNPHPDTMTFWDEIYDDHFLDAESKWEWSERNDDENETENGGSGSGEESIEEDSEEEENGEEEESGEEGDEEDENDEESNEEDGSDNGEEDEGEVDTEEGVTDSASSVTGYTFSIIALFTILNKIHSFQMLS